MIAATVHSIEELFEAIDKIRESASAYATNLFPNPHKIQGWINTRSLQMARSDRGLWLTRADRDFLHLYLCSDAEALPDTINHARASVAQTLLSDIVTRKSDDSSHFVKALIDAGFAPHTTLSRMTVKSASLPGSVTSNDLLVLRKAMLEDAGLVFDVLENTFDRFSKDLPHLEELQAFIESGCVLLAVLHDEVVGGIIFELSGRTAHMRFCWVGEGFRGRGLGRAIVENYHCAVPAANKFELWVDQNNIAAQTLYQSLGYSFDGTVDQILYSGPDLPR